MSMFDDQFQVDSIYEQRWHESDQIHGLMDRTANTVDTTFHHEVTNMRSASTDAVMTLKHTFFGLP